VSVPHAFRLVRCSWIGREPDHAASGLQQELIALLLVKAGGRLGAQRQKL